MMLLNDVAEAAAEKDKNTTLGLFYYRVRIKMWRVLTVAEKLRVGWLFKEEDLDLSIWERERERKRCVHEKFIGLRNWWGRAWDREGRRGCLRRNERDVLQKLVHVNQRYDRGGRDLHFSGALMRKDKQVFLFVPFYLWLNRDLLAPAQLAGRPDSIWEHPDPEAQSRRSIIK